jgi:putative transposase
LPCPYFGSMKYNPVKRHRSIRLKDYDYTQPGAYFVTIVAYDRAGLFGDIVDGEVHLSRYGELVSTYWQAIPKHFPHAEMDVFVVMPNHVHGIISINDSTEHFERFGKPVSGSIPTIVRSFKSVVTKDINELRHTTGASIWQRNYFEHVIRDEESLNRIRQYILANPARWDFDRENPEAVNPEAKDAWRT